MICPKKTSMFVDEITVRIHSRPLIFCSDLVQNPDEFELIQNQFRHYLGVNHSPLNGR
jgi:hypothetical protein